MSNLTPSLNLGQAAADQFLPRAALLQAGGHPGLQLIAQHLAGSPVGEPESVLSAMDRHHVVYLTVLQRHWGLPLQYRMGMQGINGAAAGGGQRRPDHLHHHR